MSRAHKTKQMIGALEYGNMPELGITNLVMRVDTGAATSSLHVDNIEEFQRNDERWIRFDIHPDIHDVERTVKCESKVLSQKKIKSSQSQNMHGPRYGELEFYWEMKVFCCGMARNRRTCI